MIELLIIHTHQKLKNKAGIGLDHILKYLTVVFCDVYGLVLITL